MNQKQKLIYNKLKYSIIKTPILKENPAIMRAYLVTEKKGQKVEELTDVMLSELSMISRIKNFLLKVVIYLRIFNYAYNLYHLF